MRVLEHTRSRRGSAVSFFDKSDGSSERGEELSKVPAQVRPETNAETALREMFDAVPVVTSDGRLFVPGNPEEIRARLVKTGLLCDGKVRVRNGAAIGIQFDADERNSLEQYFRDRPSTCKTEEPTGEANGANWQGFWIELAVTVCLFAFLYFRTMSHPGVSALQEVAIAAVMLFILVLAPLTLLLGVLLAVRRKWEPTIRLHLRYALRMCCAAVVLLGYGAAYGRCMENQRSSHECRPAVVIQSILFGAPSYGF